MACGLSKRALTDCQPRSTNPRAGFKQLMANAEITEKAQTPIKHTYACHMRIFTKPEKDLRPFMFPV